MNARSTPAYYMVDFGKLSQTDVKGVLTLTADTLCFAPKSKRVPDVLIPLDAIDAIRCIDEGRGFLGRTVKLSRQIGDVMGRNLKISMQWIFIDLNTGEEVPLMVPHPLEWRDAIMKAVKGFADHFFSSLVERTESYIKAERLADAKAMLKEVLDKLSDPAFMAWAYACLCRVQWASGNDDKAGEAFGRAQALLKQCSEEKSGLAETVQEYVAGQFFQGLKQAMDNTAKDVVEKIVAEAEGRSDNEQHVPLTPDQEPATPSPVEERLAELDRLRRKRIISDDEYAARRERILDGI